MNPEIGNVFTSARSIIFVLPQNPKVDYVASALSLSLSLEKAGKTTAVLCGSPMTVDLSRLVGVNKISDSLANKNLLIHFPGYDAQSAIDTVTYNVEGDRFELMVVTKEGFAPPTPKQVQLDYTGLATDTAVFIGVTNRNQLGRLNKNELFQTKNLVYIGDTPPTGDIPVGDSLSLITPSSVSEAVVRLLRELGLSLDPDIAGNLLFGIETATDNFISSSVSADTFEAAALCLKNGAVRHSREITSARGPAGSWKPPKTQTPPPPAPVSTTTPPPVSMPVPPPAPSSAPQKPQPPSPEWLEPKIYTGRTVV